MTTTDTVQTATGFLPLLFFGLAMFLAGFLMFLLEPIVGKMLLPALGGSPNIWNTCVLFFQSTLLCGYGYAHWADKLAIARRQRKAQIAAHLLMVMWPPLLLLPLRLPTDAPTDAHPYVWLLAALTTMTGAVFFAISTTAPLLQKWYLETSGTGARDPYFLYAVSNAGGIIGLCAYPFFLEPSLTVAQQNALIKILYLLLAVLISICGLLAWKGTSPSARSIEPADLYNAKASESIPSDKVAIDGEPSDNSAHAGESAESKVPGLAQYAHWLLLAFIPSSLILGLTTYVTTEMSPMPLFWMVPLAVYLLSFVIAFSRLSGRVLKVVQVFAAIAIIVSLGNLCARHVAHMERTMFDIVNSGASLHLLTLALVSLACHGEVAAKRPTPKYLTIYLFIVSLGGVLGSLFNAILAPSIFKAFVEYPLVLVLSLSVLIQPPAAFLKTGSGSGNRLMTMFLVFLLIGLVVGNFLTSYQFVVYRSRNFFGSLLLRADLKRCELWHGATMHGAEWLDPKKRGIPLAYYSTRTPIGQLLLWMYQRNSLSQESPKPVAPYAILGLGAGALVAYSQPEQTVQLYEINPQVIDVATNPFYFTYLTQARERKVDARIVTGDGRLELSKAPYSFFKVIVLDVFSSDNIPTHILTKEAFEMYLSKLRKDGVLAIHITNNYYDFKPVIAKLASELHLKAVVKDNFNAGEFEDSNLCEWVVLAPDETVIDRLQREQNWTPLKASKNVRLWTDDYSNPLDVLVTPLW